MDRSLLHMSGARSDPFHVRLVGRTLEEARERIAEAASQATSSHACRLFRVASGPMDEPGIRDRVRGICAALPETEEVIRNPLHSAFKVRGKTYCYYLNDHHGDGRIAITCKGLPGAQGMLIDIDPKRFYVPAYMGRHGWVGMYLDVEPIDWEQVETLLREAYRASAPKSLARQVAGGPGSAEPKEMS